MISKAVAMPRRARMYLPEHPYHIVQRGDNREACFIEPENYQFYLKFMCLYKGDGEINI